jgi:hypothetical protein
MNTRPSDGETAAQWAAGRSWAYPGGGPVNPRDDKLDPGLFTTEGSQEGFTVRAGDVLEVDLRTVFGSRSVDWWLNGRRVFADGRSVGRNWYAHLIVNLSVCAGRYHPPPQLETTEMSYEVTHLVVRRPMTTGTPVGVTTGACEDNPTPGASDHQP